MKSIFSKKKLLCLFSFFCFLVLSICGLTLPLTYKNSFAFTSTNKTETNVFSIGELWLSNSNKFNGENVELLLKVLSGNENASIENLDTIINPLARETKNANAIRNTEVNTLNKTTSQDIIVKLGELDWTVTYLSLDKNGNAILTLWLADSSQLYKGEYGRQDIYDTDKDGDNEDFIVSSFNANGGVPWGDADLNDDIEYPDNMYGTSYIRSVVLNNGGDYLSVASGEKIIRENSQYNSSIFAPFTISVPAEEEDYNFNDITDFLVTPRNVSWQENQSYLDYFPEPTDLLKKVDYCRRSNEAWSLEIGNDDFYKGSEDYNYAKVPNNDAWADDYLWLPSLTETGEGGNETGIWQVTKEQATNSIYSWFRTAVNRDNYQVYRIDKDGNSIGTSGVGGNRLSVMDFSCGVRPALHLNLNLVVEHTTTVRKISSCKIDLDGGSSEWNPYKIIIPQVKVTDNTFSYQPRLGKDYEVELLDKNGVEITGPEKIKKADTYTFRISGLDRYEGEVEVDWVLSPRDISLALVKNNLEIEPITFCDDYITPTFEELIDKGYLSLDASIIVDGEFTPIPLINDTDYELSYSNNFNKGTAKIIITGKGNYANDFEVEFEILSASINKGNVILNNNGLIEYYYGENLIPKVQVTLKLGEKIISRYVDTENTDEENVNYVITFHSKDDIETPLKEITTIGDYVVKISGVGNYEDSCTGNLKITEATILGDFITIVYPENQDSYIYTGDKIEPNFYVSFTYAEGKTYTFAEGQDFTVDYGENIDVSYDESNNVSNGGSVIITGTGKFKGIATQYFKISPKDITGTDIEFDEVASQEYMGRQLTPDVTIKDKSRNVTLHGGDYSNNYGENINVVYDEKSNIINGGSVIISGIGNYIGTKTLYFKITPRSLKESDINFGTINSVIYNGKPQEPTLNIVDVIEDRTLGLTPKIDYVPQYSNNINVTNETDKAVVLITGIGNYTGTEILYFDIITRSIKEENGGSIELDVDRVVYKGINQIPEITLKLNGVEIPRYISDENNENHVNYVIEFFLDNTPVNSFIDVNKYTIKLTGRYNYSDSITTTFTIYPYDISGSEIKHDNNFIKEFFYNKSKQTPTITLHYLDNVLEDTKQFNTIYYKQNITVGSNGEENITYKKEQNPIDAGTYKVVFNGFGNYTGTYDRTVLYSIKPISLENAIFTFKKQGEDKEFSWKDNLEYDYNGEEHKVEISSIKITVNGEELEFIDENGTYITINYSRSDNLKTDVFFNAGTITINVVATNSNNILKERNFSYSINPISLKNSSVTFKGLDTAEVIAGLEYDFNDDDQKIEIQDIKINNKLFFDENTTDYISIKYKRSLEEINETTNFVDVGTIYILVIPKNSNNILDPLTYSYKIVEISLDNSNVEYTENFVFNGKQQVSAVTSVKIGELEVKNVIKGGTQTSYVNIEYQKNGITATGNDFRDFGTITIIITPKTSNIVGRREVTYKINKKNLTQAKLDKDLTITGLEETTYNALDQTPTITITDKIANNYKLSAISDYTLSYSKDCINAGTVIITINSDEISDSNYYGFITETFIINKATITSFILQYNEGTYKESYSHRERIIPIVKAGNITLVSSDEINGEYDYKLTKENGDTLYQNDYINHGVIMVTISLISTNFTLPDTLTTCLYEIKPVAINDILFINNESFVTYNTLQHKIEILRVTTENGSRAFEEEYEVTYIYNNVETTNNTYIDAGIITVKVEAKEDTNITGVVTKDFEIKQRDILDSEIKYYIEKDGSKGDEIVFTDNKYNNQYPGENIMPEVIVIVIYNGTVENERLEIPLNYGENKDYTFGIYRTSDTKLSNNLYKNNEDNYLDIGNYVFITKGVGNYTGEIKKYYSVVVANFNESTIKFVVNTNKKTYTGDPIILDNLGGEDISVTYNKLGHSDINLIYNEDFNLYAENSTGYIQVAFKLASTEVASAKIVSKTEYEAHKNENNYFKVINGYFNNINVGVAGIVITGNSNSKFQTGTVVVAHFTIEQVEITKETLEVSGYKETYIYCGEDIVPELIVVSTTTGKTLELGADKDYIVEFSSNKNVGFASCKIIASNNNYKGNEILYSNIFKIEPYEIEDSMFSVTPTNFTYNTREQKPNITGSFNGESLKLEIDNPDFSVSFKRGNADTTNLTDSGEISVVVTGKGNFTGTITLSKTFTISKLQIRRMALSDTTAIYTGGDLKPNITIFDSNNNIIYDLKNGIIPSGIRLNYSRNDFTSIGTVVISVEIVDKNNYIFEDESSLSAEFTISKASLKGGSVTVKPSSEVYSGSAYTPTITVEITAGEDVYVVSADNYTITYYLKGEVVTELKNAGEYTIKIKGKNNFDEEEIETYFTISGYTLSLEDASISLSYNYQKFTFNGSCQEPVITLKHNNKTLSKGNDYVIEYRKGSLTGDASYTDNPTDAGKYYLIIRGNGNYTGEISGESYYFDIESINLDNAIIKFKGITGEFGNTTKPNISYYYTGKPQKVEVESIKINGNELYAGKENVISVLYTKNSITNVDVFVETDNFTDIGTIKVKIEEFVNRNDSIIGSYEFSYTINPISLNDAIIKFEGIEGNFGNTTKPNLSFNYDGQTHKVEVTSIVIKGTEFYSANNEIIAISYTRSDNKRDNFVDAGTINISINPVNTNNIENTLIFTYTINALTLSKENITFKKQGEDEEFSWKDDLVYDYNGKEQKVIITGVNVIIGEENIELLNEDNSFINVSYFRDKTLTDNFINSGTISIVIEPVSSNNIKNSLTFVYIINALDLEDAVVSFTDETEEVIEINNLVYDYDKESHKVIITNVKVRDVELFDEKNPLVEVTYKREGEETPNEDFVKSGIIFIYITPKTSVGNNITGSISYSYKINRLDLNSTETVVTFEGGASGVEDCVFNSNSQKQVITNIEVQGIEVLDRENPFVTISYKRKNPNYNAEDLSSQRYIDTEDFTNVGEIFIFVEAIEEFDIYGSLSYSYIINQKSFNSSVINVLGLEDRTYNRNEHSFDIILKDTELKDEQDSLKLDGYILIKNKDYSIKFSTEDFTNAQKNIVCTFTALNGNYKTGESFTKTFSINQAIVTNFSLTSSYGIYNSNPQIISAIVEATTDNKIIQIYDTDDYKEYKLVFYRGETAVGSSGLINAGNITVQLTLLSSNYVFDENLETTLPYVIEKAEITTIKLKQNDRPFDNENYTIVFDNKEHIIGIDEIKAGNLSLNETDYIVEYYIGDVKQSTSTYKNICLVKVKVLVVEDSNYKNSIDGNFVTFEITQKDITINDVKYLVADDYLKGIETEFKLNAKYKGESVIPKITVNFEEEYVLTLNNAGETGDYTFAIYREQDRENNLFGTTDYLVSGNYIFIINCKNNFSGNITSSYIVSPADFNKDTITVTLPTQSAIKYTGNPIEFVLSGENKNCSVSYSKSIYETSFELVFNTDFELFNGYVRAELGEDDRIITAYSVATKQDYDNYINQDNKSNLAYKVLQIVNGYVDNIYAGFASFVISGKSPNFANTIILTQFAIEQTPLQATVSGIDRYHTFTGSPIDPVPDKTKIKVLTNTGEYLVYEKDFTIEFFNNTNVGNAGYIIRTVEGSNFNGTLTIANGFEILPKVIEKKWFTISENTIFNTEEQKPKVQNAIYNSNELYEGKDFDVEYRRDGKVTTDFTNFGEITLVITGKGNYSNVDDKPLEFTYKIEKWEINEIRLSILEVTYNAQNQKPDVEVYDENEIKIPESYIYNGTSISIYEITYSNEDFTNAGSIKISVNIIDSNNFKFVTGKDQVYAMFTINKELLSKTSVSIENQTFTGLEIMPTFTISLGESLVDKETEYSVLSYSNNINVGKAKIVITSNGVNFIGRKEIEFSILPKELEDDMLSLINEKNLVYNGEKHTLNYEVKYIIGEDNILLEKDVDFVETYENNINAGNNAILKLEGINNYTGIINYKFSISKATPKVIVNLPNIDLFAGDSLENSNFLILGEGSTLGTITNETVETLILANTVTWNFTPTDTQNYNTQSGTVNIPAFYETKIEFEDVSNLIVNSNINVIKKVTFKMNRNEDTSYDLPRTNYNIIITRNGYEVSNYEQSGQYNVKIEISNLNYKIFGSDNISFKVKPTTIYSYDKNFYAVNEFGFELDISLYVKPYSKQEDILNILGEEKYMELEKVQTLYYVSLYSDNGEVEIANTTIYCVASADSDYYTFKNGNLEIGTKINGNVVVENGTYFIKVLIAPSKAEGLIKIVAIAIGVAVIFIIIIIIVAKKHKKNKKKVLQGNGNVKKAKQKAIPNSNIRTQNGGVQNSNNVVPNGNNQNIQQQNMIMRNQNNQNIAPQNRNMQNPNMQNVNTLIKQVNPNMVNGNMQPNQNTQRMMPQNINMPPNALQNNIQGRPPMPNNQMQNPININNRNMVANQNIKPKEKKKLFGRGNKKALNNNSNNIPPNRNGQQPIFTNKMNNMQNINPYSGYSNLPNNQTRLPQNNNRPVQQMPPNAFRGGMNNNLPPNRPVIPPMPNNQQGPRANIPNANGMRQMQNNPNMMQRNNNPNGMNQYPNGPRPINNDVRMPINNQMPNNIQNQMNRQMPMNRQIPPNGQMPINRQMPINNQMPMNRQNANNNFSNNKAPEKSKNGINPNGVFNPFNNKKPPKK